jgi:signal peptidase
MGWKALALASNTPIPMVVVTSESMEPGLQRGDILLLWNRYRNLQVGDIPVIWFQDHQLPMVRTE